MTDENRNAITLSAMERWKIGQFKRTTKELSQFDDKKPEELESEFNHFDVDNSYLTSPFKGHNIDRGFRFRVQTITHFHRI